MEQKMVGHFLKWWAQAYQTNHSWLFGFYTLPTHWQKHLYAYMYIGCWLYSKTCPKLPLKKEDQLSLNAGQKYCRMLQAEHSVILSTFIKLPFVIKIFVLSILSGCLRQVLLYWLLYINFLFVEFILAVRWIFFIKVRFFHNKKRWVHWAHYLGNWKVMGNILKSWDNDPGPP